MTTRQVDPESIEPDYADIDDLVGRAIDAVGSGELAYCKFLSANDTGGTGSHQRGPYIELGAYSILFDEPPARGSNEFRHVEIHWHNDTVTQSRFGYYGVGTRNEYRVTRFGRGFPFMQPEHAGDLFVLIKRSHEDYQAFLLDVEENIDRFLEAFALSPTETGRIIERETVTLDDRFEAAFDEYIKEIPRGFPTSAEMSAAARRIFATASAPRRRSLSADELLISWIDTEYRLFRKIELSLYGDLVTAGFASLDDFLDTANSVLNRRKSRAGKALENHLEAMFAIHGLSFDAQPVIEGNKRPDFLFPGGVEYHDDTFPAARRVFLAAKTTCKDRWRQILNEAERIPAKHLFTLQQAISSRQLDEMGSARVTLVVPKPYHRKYPLEWRKRIMTLESFLNHVRRLSES